MDQNMNERPLVSILMITWNRARYIREAVESVLNQTYRNWELFVIDDGSTDKTADLPAIRNHDPRLRFVPAHYLHSSGNFNVYDPQARVLFSGDIGAALGDDDLILVPVALQPLVARDLRPPL